eukprot:95627-Hanusia_phi.AAC.2
MEGREGEMGRRGGERHRAEEKEGGGGRRGRRRREQGSRRTDRKAGGGSKTECWSKLLRSYKRLQSRQPLNAPTPVLQCVPLRKQTVTFLQHLKQN